MLQTMYDIVYSTIHASPCMYVCKLCLRKKQSTFFFSQLCQMFTKFDNFWHKNDQDDEIIQRALTFHLT